MKKERKAALERHYSFPKEPARLIFPSKTAKNGKFECKVASIQSLLDYRLEDNKEASFEVGLKNVLVHVSELSFVEKCFPYLLIVY